MGGLAGGFIRRKSGEGAGHLQITPDSREREQIELLKYKAEMAALEFRIERSGAMRGEDAARLRLEVASQQTEQGRFAATRGAFDNGDAGAEDLGEIIDDRRLAGCIAEGDLLTTQRART